MIPNLLTWGRIALIPLLVVVYYLPTPHAGPLAAAVFLAAAITDALDGWLARRLGQESPFGAFLDPVADKLIVATALVLLVEVHGGLVLTVASVVIIGREIAISALREWMAEIGRRGKVAVSSLGKIKTVLQMTAITMLLWHEALFGLPVFTAGLALLAAAAALTLWSMVAYLRVAWSDFG